MAGGLSVEYRENALIKKLFLLSAVSFTLYAQSVSLEELLKSSSEQSFNLKMFKSDEEISHSNLYSVYSQYYPSLALSYNTEYNRDEDGLPTGTESVGNTIITSGTRYQSSLSLNLNYELYHFGVSDKSVHMAEYDVDIKHLLWCEEEKRLHQSILDRYSSALKMKTKSDFKSKMLDIRRTLYKVKKRLYVAGKSSKIDLGDEAIFIIDLEREVELSIMQYKEDIIQLSALSHVELDDVNTELLDIGFDNNSDLVDSFSQTTEGLKYSKMLKQKKEEISRNKRLLFPTISTYGNYYFYGSNPSSVYDSFEDIKRNSWKVGLSLQMTIFEGFKYNHDRHRLTYELQRLEDEKNQKQREYQYNAKSKVSKIQYLNILEDKDDNLFKETQEKIVMIERLREDNQIDSMSELQANLEHIERELNLKIERSERAYENASLHILYRGVDQCTQH